MLISPVDVLTNESAPVVLKVPPAVVTDAGVMFVPEAQTVDVP